ncbi:hypothetical protein ACN6KO_06215 [Enterococcus faecium]
MKRIIKIFGVLGVFLLGLSTFVSTGTSVYATEKVNTVDLEIKNKLVDELTFILIQLVFRRTWCIPYKGFWCYS